MTTDLQTITKLFLCIYFFYAFRYVYSGRSENSWYWIATANFTLAAVWAMESL